jgi:plasmid stability protein
MATLTIKNIPDTVIQRLKARAARHRRSLNLEVIASLEAIAQATPLDPDAILARIREVRQRPVRLKLTDRTLARLKATGRP